MVAVHTTDTTFREFGLDPRLIQALDKAGFSHCTPIQAESLPVILSGKDIAGQAQTGTGKTAAFLLAIFNHLLQKSESGSKSPRALVIAPTRELAIQIHKDAMMLNEFCGLKLGLVYGGVDYDKQKSQLEDGVEILIGTPGRLIDYFKQGVYQLKTLQIVVLDEADRMFDLGFIKDIRYMFRRMRKPQDRLNMLFSATLSYRVTELAYEHMNNPQFVRINPEQVTADRITQVIYHVANEEKIPLLIGLLRQIDPKRTIIFVNTRRAAEKISGYLEGNNYQASILSGDVPQKKRQRLFHEFSEGKLPILVATDLAARGLHIPEVSHVINFDLPQNAEDYVHRIGRTARAGAKGDAVSFGCEEFVYSLSEIEDYLGYKIPVEKVDYEMLQNLELKPPVKSASRHAKRHSTKSGDQQKRNRRHRHKQKS